ncbi:hypothetical protein GUJ93_ZPchr0010g9638 [Zizania palustris]|uniref:Uncharacterized protein n=1 Tax=Zizania palustris TaxID=103762 RepID=A0A8J5WE99_ZIZPA|nr:hypothetical protein GUJ93_ZPchr0010g9638 [Zizania palustris]
MKGVICKKSSLLSLISCGKLSVARLPLPPSPLRSLPPPPSPWLRRCLRRRQWRRRARNAYRASLRPIQAWICPGKGRSF